MMMNKNILPLFPLGIVAFPDENVNLHIFEPRYKQLITECNDTGNTFGIVPFINRKLMHFGTEMQIISIDKIYTNGEMDIKTKGLTVFKLNDFLNQIPDKLYGGGNVSAIATDTETDFFVNQQIMELVQELFVLLEIKKTLPEIDGSFYSYKLGHLVGFSIEQEYEFLIIRSEYERQVFMLKHLERLLPIIREMQRLQERAKLNGHFRNIIPPDFS
jgi:ATP-dependent Lon protease